MPRVLMTRAQYVTFHQLAMFRAKDALVALLKNDTDIAAAAHAARVFAGAVLAVEVAQEIANDKGPDVPTWVDIATGICYNEPETTDNEDETDDDDTEDDEDPDDCAHCGEEYDVIYQGTPRYCLECGEWEAPR